MATRRRIEEVRGAAQLSIGPVGPVSLPRDSSESRPEWTTAALGAVYVLVAAYLLSLFVGSSHRAIYDRIANARVILSHPNNCVTEPVAALA
jgi:hypothetical protein